MIIVSKEKFSICVIIGEVIEKVLDKKNGHHLFRQVANLFCRKAKKDGSFSKVTCPMEEVNPFSQIM